MSDVLGCGAPPVRYNRGGNEYVETCARAARRWDASKGGHTETIVRCDHHAGKLRAAGYDVHVAAAPAKAAKPKWDMTSTDSLEAAAEWLRKQGQAVMVVVIRAGDAVVVADEGITTGDVCGILERCVPEALVRFEQTHPTPC